MLRSPRYTNAVTAMRLSPIPMNQLADMSPSISRMTIAGANGSRSANSTKAHNVVQQTPQKHRPRRLGRRSTPRRSRDHRQASMESRGRRAYSPPAAKRSSQDHQVRRPPTLNLAYRRTTPPNTQARPLRTPKGAPVSEHARLGRRPNDEALPTRSAGIKITAPGGRTAGWPVAEVDEPLHERHAGLNGRPDCRIGSRSVSIYGATLETRSRSRCRNRPAYVGRNLRPERLSCRPVVCALTSAGYDGSDVWAWLCGRAGWGGLWVSWFVGGGVGGGASRRLCSRGC